MAKKVFFKYGSTDGKLKRSNLSIFCLENHFNFSFKFDRKLFSHIIFNFLLGKKYMILCNFIKVSHIRLVIKMKWLENYFHFLSIMYSVLKQRYQTSKLYINIYVHVYFIYIAGWPDHSTGCLGEEPTTPKIRKKLYLIIMRSCTINMFQLVINMF